MSERFADTLVAFLRDGAQRASNGGDTKHWRRTAVELLEYEYDRRLRDWAPYENGGALSADDLVQAFYLRELTAKRTVLEQWDAERGRPLAVFLKKCFQNFVNTEYRRERRRAFRRFPADAAWGEWVADDPETSDPVRILVRRDVAAAPSAETATPEAVDAAGAAFRAYCGARGLGHYWTVFERHDLRPEAFGHPRHADTAVAMGRSRRDVTNWLVRARKWLRRFAETQAGDL